MTFEISFPACRAVRRAALALAISFGWGAAAAPASATDPRFVPSASGDEVTDTQTGLIWRRCLEGQTWTGSTCAGSYGTYTWDNALAHAKSTANSTGVAWRLPNVKELQSLVDRSMSIPLMIDSSVFPGTPGISFWTSTPYAGDASSAWFVYFYNGFVYYGGRGSSLAVRLVRAGQ
jgi:Protein of unknown function (DUF1566)